MRRGRPLVVVIEPVGFVCRRVGLHVVLRLVRELLCSFIITFAFELSKLVSISIYRLVFISELSQLLYFVSSIFGFLVSMLLSLRCALVFA